MIEIRLEEWSDMKPVYLDDVRLKKNKSFPVPVDYLEPLFQRVDNNLIKSLTASGKKYVSSLAEYRKIIIPFQKAFEINKNQRFSNTDCKRQKTLERSIVKSKKEILKTLSSILTSSLCFDKNVVTRTSVWDYIAFPDEKHVITRYQKSHFYYSYARLFIDRNLFYFGLELYIINEVQACAYQKVVLFRYPNLVP